MNLVLAIRNLLDRRRRNRPAHCYDCGIDRVRYVHVEPETGGGVWLVLCQACHLANADVPQVDLGRDRYRSIGYIEDVGNGYSAARDAARLRRCRVSAKRLRPLAHLPWWTAPELPWWADA